MDDILTALIKRTCEPLEPIATDMESSVVQMPNIRAVLFDIYGTLLISGSGDIGNDTGQNRAQALASAVEINGWKLSCDPEGAVNRLEAEIRTVHAELRASGNEHPEVDIVKIWTAVLPDILVDMPDDANFARFSLEYELRVNPVWTMPGLIETLEMLTDPAMLLGIVSNAQFFTPLYFPAITDRSMNDLGFSGGLTYFSYRYRRAKPGTFLFECARNAVAQLDISEQDVLYVGNDMLNDIATASQVGFKTALFAGDQRSLRLRSEDARIRGVQPDLVVTDLRQIPMCLK